MEMSEKVVGIDYSVSCPAMCICLSKEFSFENCKFTYTTDSNNWNRKEYLDGQIIGHSALDPDMYADIDRLSHLSDLFMDDIMDHIDDGERLNVGLEDYAFAGNGKITLLAENMGILKLKLRDEHHVFHSYSPATIKKFARESFPVELQRMENGKLLIMDKQKMYEAFCYDTRVNLLEIFGLDSLLTKSGTPRRSNPITDIVDAYFIAKYHNKIINK